jgi:hypothetical protein
MVLVEKDLEDGIENRCDSALQKNENYLSLQAELAIAHQSNDIESFSKISYCMQVIAMRTSYKIAIKDIFSIVHE